MAYTITVTNGSPITIATGDSDLSTSLTLIGKSFPNYGQLIAQNFVNLMQNFAGTSEPNGVLTGQLWYDTSTNLLKVYNGSSFTRLATTVVSTTTPAAANAGDLWYDIDDIQLKVYDGATWLNVGPSTFATPVVSDNIADIANNIKSVGRISVSGANVAVFSSQAFTAKTSYTGITNIIQGFYFHQNVTVNNNLAVTNNLSVGGNLTVTGTANLTASAAKYADLAEKYWADKNYDAGTVVKIGGNREITICNDDCSSDVFGCISLNPAYLMNNNNFENYLPVVLHGRSVVKVVGQVAKGDRLVSAGNGSARKGLPQELSYQTEIGRALDDKNYDEPALVECFIVVK